MNARDELLGRVRAAVAGAAPVTVPREYRRAGEDGTHAGAVLDLLVDRLLDYRATVDRVAAGGVADAVDRALGDAASVVVPPGLDPDARRGAGARGRDVVQDDALPPAELDRLAAVVTGAAVAIAATGTIVLDGSAGQGRRAVSLVPDLHVVVLRADQVVPSVPDGLARLDPVRPITLISGPSATSDIELSRVEGVHGPRRLRVVLAG